MAGALKLFNKPNEIYSHFSKGERRSTSNEVSTTSQAMGASD
jgi:hypothetical protein